MQDPQAIPRFRELLETALEERGDARIGFPAVRDKRVEPRAGVRGTGTPARGELTWQPKEPSRRSESSGWIGDRQRPSLPLEIESPASGA
jgi:hypothetical protein